MNIEIFKSLTTDDAIKQLEAEGEKYTGLFVDMSDKEARKYVKDQAVVISDLIKKVDRKRIDESKRYKAKVETEAKSIIDRLKIANEPYTLLIDAHKAERAKILADEKRVIELRAAMLQKEDDHEMALLINKTFEYDKAEAIRINNEKQAILEAEAEKRVIARQKQSEEAAIMESVNAENARLANVEHVRGINREILSFMLGLGLDEVSSMDFIKALARKELPQLTINY
jgi:hypothetical protein